MYTSFKILLAVNLICVSFVAHAQISHKNVTQTFYIIRHAEKDKGNNPALSTSGFKRAGDLYKVLKNKHIDKIYATKYRRTQMTGDSLRIYAHIKMIEYDTDTTGKGLEEKMEQEKENGKNILIIGHSNTIIPIIKKLGVTDLKRPDIPDNEFDNLFIVTIKNKKATLLSKKYGARSIKKYEGNKMNPLQ